MSTAYGLSLDNSLVMQHFPFGVPLLFFAGHLIIDTAQSRSHTTFF